LVLNLEEVVPSTLLLKSHIAIPLMIDIDEDGIVYGFYEPLDIPEAPLTPAGEGIEWTTDIIVPEDVSGLYIYSVLNPRSCEPTYTTLSILPINRFVVCLSVREKSASFFRVSASCFDRSGRNNIPPRSCFRT
jgi:hypothetical protein